MAIGSVTVDKARVRREVRSGERVLGGYRTEATWSESFRCRYTPARESESRAQGGIRRVKPATLLVTARALRAAGVGALRASDRVEIVQRGGEPFLMEVKGEPEQVRKRSTVIAYVAALEKVRDSEPADA